MGREGVDSGAKDGEVGMRRAVDEVENEGGEAEEEEEESEGDADGTEDGGGRGVAVEDMGFGRFGDFSHG